MSSYPWNITSKAIQRELVVLVRVSIRHDDRILLPARALPGTPWTGKIAVGVEGGVGGGE